MSAKQRKTTYVCLSTSFWRDIELQDLTMFDRGLVAQALSYCGDVMNDGVMTERDWQMITLGCVPEDVPPSVSRLVSAGVLAHVPGGGYSMPAWSEWNFTREEVEAKREAWRKKKQKQRQNGGNKPKPPNVPTSVPQDVPHHVPTDVPPLDIDEDIDDVGGNPVVQNTRVGGTPILDEGSPFQAGAA